MRVGVSTYSLLPAIRAGEMTVLDVVEWIAENGGQHMEIVPYGFTLEDNPELTDAVRERAAEVGIALSNYSMPANFVQESGTTLIRKWNESSDMWIRSIDWE